MPRRTLLYVSPEIPRKTGSGMAIRSGSQILALAEQFAVSVAVMTELPVAEAEATIPPEIRAAAATLTIVSAKSAMVRLLERARTAQQRLLIQALAPLPLMHARAAAGLAPLADAIAAVHGGRRFDVLHCFRVATAPIEGLLRRRGVRFERAVLDIDDNESFAKWRTVRDLGAMLGRQARVAAWLEVFKLRRIERRMIPRFDDAFVCSVEDQSRMRERFPAVRWFVVPNVVFEPPVFVRQRNPLFTLLFVGTLDYGPNHDGLAFFMRTVREPLREAVAAPYRLIIAGRHPGPQVRALAQDEAVMLVADPPDLTSLYAQADAAIVPIRFGGGTRIKILEAFSYGVPVVSTELGAEGLALMPGTDLLIANDAVSFARACARLIEDSALRDRLAVRAAQLYRERFSLEQLRRLISAIFAQPGGEWQALP